MTHLLLWILYTLPGALCKTALKPDVKLSDSVTLPCEQRNHTVTPLEQLDVQWWLGEQLVSRLDQGLMSYGINYRNRAEIPVGGARHGDFSLTITHTQHGDSGVYRCVIRRENQEDTLGEVELRIEVPWSPSAMFVKVGEEVVLPCFGRVDWFDSEAELVRWKRWDKLILHWENGFLYVDHQFSDRASLPKEEILKDNLSLILKNIRHEDQGLYCCSFVKDQKIQPAAQINLTVTDHLTQVEAGSGSSVLLPLHTESAVSVWFLPDGGNDTVPVCEVKQGQLKCEAAYTHRTVLHNYTLNLKNLLVLDSGMFSVMDRGSQRTVSVLSLQVLPAGDTVVNADSTTVVIIIITTVLVMIVVATLVMITLKRRRWRRLTMEWPAEVLHLKHVDATSSDESVADQNLSQEMSDRTPSLEPEDFLSSEPEPRH